MRGPPPSRKVVAPHQFGRMTYGRATERSHADREERATVSHGLTSSPPRGEANVERGSWHEESNFRRRSQDGAAFSASNAMTGYVIRRLVLVGVVLVAVSML